jgi:hypothetical protein
MTASDYAAWWGAVVATVVFAWDIIKWKKNGPRLKVSVAQTEQCGPMDFALVATNIGNEPALVEKVSLQLLVGTFRRKIVILDGPFSLSGGYGFPPVTIAPGHPWFVRIGLSKKLPQFPSKSYRVFVEFHEAHREKPRRIFPDASRFIAEVKRQVEKQNAAQLKGGAANRA